MLQRVVRFFWPDIKEDDVQKFSILALTFFCIIGSYWMFRLLKDTVFFKIAFPEALGWAPEQGGLFVPIAKAISPFVVIFCVLVYSKLVDIFKKHQLFYVICSFYAALFGVITALLVVRNMYGDAALGKNLLAAVGWVAYFGIESFGSIMVPLFWSFTISITDSNTAKVGFPLIIAGAQIGSIGGSALNIFSEQLGGVWRLFLIGTLFVLAVIGLIYYFMKVMPKDELVGNKEAAKEEKTHKKEGFIEGFVSGLTLLFTKPYLLGILVVSTIYEVVGTIMDYQMKRQASVFPAFSSEVGFNKFMGIFGVCANGLAFVMALLGTSYLLKKYGIKVCLLIYPICFGIALIGFYCLYTFAAPSASTLLWATFAVMMIVKGLSYAVNNPTKEMMYIPTSKDAKYKAKGWIDMFGGRTAKAAGSAVTNSLKKDMATLMTYGTLFGLGLIGFWIVVAIFVANKNQKLIKDGTIVG